MMAPSSRGRSPSDRCCLACQLPGPEQLADDARGWPVAVAQPLERGASPPVRMGARPVVGGGEPAVAFVPLSHCVDHPLAGPLPLDRARTAPLAVPVSVALAVARLGVGAAAAAEADVAGLDRPGLLPGGVVEVRLDRGPRPAETFGDLRDRQTLLVPVVPGQSDGTPALEHTVHFGFRSDTDDRNRAAWGFPGRPVRLTLFCSIGE